MKTEHINSSQVRHEWKNIVRGLEAGTRYVVENFGKPEAVVMPPDAVSDEFDLDEFFRKVRSLPRVRLKDVEIWRAPEL